MAFSYQYGQTDATYYLLGGYEYRPPIPLTNDLHSLRFSGGLSYMATRNLAVVTDLTYQQDFYDYDNYGDKCGRGISLSLGLAFFIW